MTNFTVIAATSLNRFHLLAGEAQYIHMGRRFRRGGGGIDWTELLIPVAVIVGVLGVAWLVSSYLKYRDARNADSPQSLFAELCHAHGLDWPSQQLLLALANANRLASPVQLFVEPEHFQVERLGDTFANRTAQVAALHEKLFAVSASEGPESF